jgi:hypothetical protein
VAGEREVEEMNVYVAICFDRHVDDAITVHPTLEEAIAECQRFMNIDYYARYGEWHREPSIEDDGWPYAIRFSLDDGPRARVEKTTLKQQESDA